MKSNKAGFTLIEMIVVVAILGIALPALFAIIFMVMRQQIKVIRLAEVKRQGDHVIDVVGVTLRSNAVGVYSNTPLNQANEVCAGSPSSALFTGADTTARLKDKNGDDLYFYVNANKIIFSSTGNYAGEGTLTTDKLLVSNFSIRCDRTVAFSPAIVTLSFKICYLNSPTDTVCPTNRNEEIATLDYATKIKLRNQ